MRKILNEWRKFLTEQESDLGQARIEIAKKMNNFLFGVHHISKGAEILSKYTFLHWAIYGTKQEKEEVGLQYRPEIGDDFVNEKINLFLSYLTPNEASILVADIPHLKQLLFRGDIPNFPVHLPVEMTGHAGVDPSFQVPFIAGKSIDDWGMGGTIKDPSGNNYIFTILDRISQRLSQYNPATETTEEKARSFYFMGQKPPEPEPEPVKNRGRFSHALNIPPHIKAMMDAASKRKK